MDTKTGQKVPSASIRLPRSGSRFVISGLSEGIPWTFLPQNLPNAPSGGTLALNLPRGVGSDHWNHTLPISLGLVFPPAFTWKLSHDLPC